MKGIVLLSLLLGCAKFCIAQDTIFQKNGLHIAAKVLEIDKAEVKYKKYENPEGPSYILPKKDIQMIRYQNGTTDTFSIAVAEPAPKLYTKQPLSEMYLKGQQDAEQYYKNYKPAANWTLGLTIPLNAIGVIPAVAFSATPPSRENLGYPDENLLKNPDYLNGYVTKAKDKKGSKVMKSFAIGCLASFVMYGTLLIAVK